MSALTAKQQELKTRTAEAVTLRDKIAASETPDADEQKAFDKLMDETIPGLETEIKRLAKLEEVEGKTKTDDEEEGEQPERKTKDAPARVQERFEFAPTIGEQLVNSDAYKKSLKNGPGGRGMTAELKGGIFGDIQTKDTFTSTLTGLDSTVNYLRRPVELIQQQRLTVRDLLPVGQTTQNAVKWIKEDSFTNSAATTAEEGQKPEASFDTGPASADVKKIAVISKVTDEMWADFPMLRDYLNTRLRFMVEQVEEDELLNGSGSGNHLTGILNASIQSQAKGGDTNLDAIHKAVTKIRTPASNVGGYEPDGIVMHPTDYQLIRLAKDSANQYYGGGPFDTGMYGNGTYKDMVGPWGLRCVVTTAIAAGTALVGAFRIGAQIWQREGIDVRVFDQNEDDVNFNRLTLRVEERLALAIYAPSAFCKVTSIA